MDTTVQIIVYLGFLIQYASSLGEHSVQYIGPSLLSEGDLLTLSCVTPFHDTSTWTVNSSVLITDENLLGFELMERRLYSVYKEMILSTPSAQLFHSGEYRCSGNSRDYHMVRVVENAETATEVTEPPLPLSKHNKRDGGDRYPIRYLYEPSLNYKFTCETEDAHYPVMWFKNMHQIDSYTYPNIELYDNHLIIHQAQMEDIGEYSCIKMDRDYQPGKRHIVSRYLLISPAEIVDISEKQNVIRGRSMTLYCRAKGYPLPRITWYIGNLNAYMLKEKDLRISIYSKREKYSNAYLTVRNMSYYDRNLYTCRAENGLKQENGKRFHEKSLTVYVRDNIIEPNEDEPGWGKVLIPGEPLFLQCKTEECPYCSIVWFKEGVKLSSDDKTMHIDEENNSLTIHSALVNDTGLYECAVDRDQINVDLRASIRVRICEDLLDRGFTIENVCEIPMIEAMASGSRASLLEFLFLVLLVSLWTKIMD